MKLTLTAGGGVTGLTKEYSIDLTPLKDATRRALLEYINNSGAVRPSHFNESWILDDGKEVPIDKDRMNDELKDLYDHMKKNLNYPK